MPRLSLLVGAFIVGTFASFGSVSVVAQDTNAMLTAYVEALNVNMPPNTNGDAIAALFTEDGVHGHAMLPPRGVKEPQEGRAEIAAFFSGFATRWVDWTNVETRRTVQGNRAVFEGMAQGTHMDTGKFVKIPIVFSLEFNEHGKVTNKLVYVNGAMAAAQLK